jgi:hypothetical protein
MKACFFISLSMYCFNALSDDITFLSNRQEGIVEKKYLQSERELELSKEIIPKVGYFNKEDCQELQNDWLLYSKSEMEYCSRIWIGKSRPNECMYPKISSVKENSKISKCKGY